MFSKKRKLRKQNRFSLKQKIGVICLITIVILLLASAGVYFYFVRIREHGYISPLVKACQQAKFCMPSEDDIHLNFVKQSLTAKQMQYKDVTYTNATYTISLENGSQVILSAKKDINSQISSLQYIVSRLTMEGRQFKKLDLRFDKPIVVF